MRVESGGNDRSTRSPSSSMDAYHSPNHAPSDLHKALDRPPYADVGITPEPTEASWVHAPTGLRRLSPTDAARPAPEPSAPPPPITCVGRAPALPAFPHRPRASLHHPSHRAGAWAFTGGHSRCCRPQEPDPRSRGRRQRPHAGADHGAVCAGRQQPGLHCAGQRQHGQVELLVRAQHDRNLPAQPGKLFAAIRQAPVHSRVQVHVPRHSARPKKTKQKARPRRSGRTADMQVRHQSFALPPTDGHQGKHPLDLCLVHALEQEPPPKRQAHRVVSADHLPHRQRRTGRGMLALVLPALAHPLRVEHAGFADLRLGRHLRGASHAAPRQIRHVCSEIPGGRLHHHRAAHGVPIFRSCLLEDAVQEEARSQTDTLTGHGRSLPAPSVAPRPS